MTNEEPAVPVVEHMNQWLTAVASLAVGAAFFALWFWLLPRWLDFRVEMAGMARWRWLAAVPSVLGFAVALRCVWDFGWTGRGTPAPVAPPKRLVVVGFYRYVRNPMYFGFAVGWIGLWIVFGHANPLAIGAVAVVALGVHLFVVFYEEPTLRKKFGAEYEEYCRNVHRWWPRARGWENHSLLLVADPHNWREQPFPTTNPGFWTWCAAPACGKANICAPFSICSTKAIWAIIIAPWDGQTRPPPALLKRNQVHDYCFQRGLSQGDCGGRS